jgi:hypothetical protein
LSLDGKEGSVMLSVIPISDKDQWDRSVRSFREHDIYYFSGYGKAFQVHGDGEPVLFYYEGDGFRAINAVMKRDISLNGHFAGKLDPNQYYDLITPYGYGGFLVEGDPDNGGIRALNAEYTAYCIENNIVSEFARFHPILKNKEIIQGMYDIEERGKTVFIDLDSPEFIWDHFTGKNRNMIRKAQKSGVEIFWGRSPKLMINFGNLYKAAMDKNNADDYYYFKKQFYDCNLYDLKNNCMIFYAVYQEKIIAMSIILHGNRQMHYHLSASDEFYKHLAPTNLLLYEAACWGSANNFKTFHLGGGLHSAEDNLFHFKKAFHTGSDAVYAIGKKCFQTEVYDKLVSIRAVEKNFVCNSSFFPLYRQ